MCVPTMTNPMMGTHIAVLRGSAWYRIHWAARLQHWQTGFPPTSGYHAMDMTVSRFLRLLPRAAKRGSPRAMKGRPFRPEEPFSFQPAILGLCGPQHVTGQGCMRIPQKNGVLTQERACRCVICCSWVRYFLNPRWRCFLSGQGNSLAIDVDSRPRGEVSSRHGRPAGPQVCSGRTPCLKESSGEIRQGWVLCGRFAWSCCAAGDG